VIIQQKVVIKLQMDCDKCRNKALKIAAEVPGEHHMPIPVITFHMQNKFLSETFIP